MIKKLPQADIDDLERSLQQVQYGPNNDIIVIPNTYIGTIGEIKYFDNSVITRDAVSVLPIEFKSRKYEESDAPARVPMSGNQISSSIGMNGPAHKFQIGYVYYNQKYCDKIPDPKNPKNIRTKNVQLGDAVSYYEEGGYWRVENGEDKYGGIVIDIITESETKIFIGRDYPYYYPEAKDVISAKPNSAMVPNAMEEAPWKDVRITGNLVCNSTDYITGDSAEEYEALVSKLMTFFKLPEGTPVGDMMAKLDRAIGYKPKAEAKHTGSSDTEMQMGTYTAPDGKVYALGIERVVNHQWEGKKEDGRAFGVDLPYDEPENY